MNKHKKKGAELLEPPSLIVAAFVVGKRSRTKTPKIDGPMS